nr:zinc finger, CCHC-type, retrotransposon Gag domain protein [Tanacetum cinerariifolium]
GEHTYRYRPFCGCSERLAGYASSDSRTGSGSSNAGGNPPPVTIHTWLERFNKQKPNSFKKATVSVDAKNWISHMEKIFDVMGCEDAFKTRLAVYKFESNALAWWKAYKQAKGGDACCWHRGGAGEEFSVGPTQFDDKIRAINAFPLNMCEFDLILGMDCLTEHHATIDCHSYQVIFGDIHAPEYIYHGSLLGKSMQIISALQARTLPYHGCEGFLATIHDMTSEIPSIHDQPIGNHNTMDD